ncbi:MAG: helicase-related protein [Candidatus Thorarchaeota archaeon]
MIIDNEAVTLLGTVKNLLKTAQTVKIGVGYFYISGFELIEEDLAGLEKVCILMGPETGSKTTEKLLGKSSLTEQLSSDLRAAERALESAERVGRVHSLLTSGKLQVRILTDRRFHSKAYIFRGESSSSAIVGSSNLTYGGLVENLELNVVLKDSRNVDALEDWFDKLWEQAEDFGPELLTHIESSKVFEYIKTGMPPSVYLPPLEFMKTLVKTTGKEYLLTEEGLLMPFQELDYKIAKDVISQYGGVLIANSVGLGKSYIACRILKDYLKEGKRILLIIPPNLREQWEGYLRIFDIPPTRIAILSMYELSQGDFDREKYSNFEVILVDESHNFRNPQSNRTKNFMRSVKNSNAVYILLSATPINNTLGDLLTQIDMFMLPEKFKSGGIHGLYTDLVNYVKTEDDSLKPAIYDLRSRLIVRTTRKMLLRMYKEIVLPGRGRVKFREPDLDAKKYSLRGPVYKEVFDRIVGFLSSLELPHLRILNPEGGRVLVGLYSILLYKRLESSIYAFYQSILAIERRERRLRELLQTHTPSEIRAIGQDALSTFLDGIDEAQMTLVELDPEGPDDWERDIYLSHIREDLKKLKQFRELIENLMIKKTKKKTVFKDDKLDLLKRFVSKNMDKKILLFTQFKDTANYLHGNLQDVAEEDFQIRIVTGDTKDKMMEVIRFSPTSQEDIIARTFKLDGQRTDFLVSTDALSEGVNLQEADIVVNYDLPWNPVRIIQRVGRVDRIGSNKRFKVVNFIPARSIDKGLGLLRRLNEKIDNIIEILGVEHSILTLEEREKIKGQEKKLISAIGDKVDAQRRLQLEKLDVEYEAKKLGNLDKYIMSHMLDSQVRARDLVDVVVPDRQFYTVLQDAPHRLLFVYSITDGLTRRFESVIGDGSTWDDSFVPHVERLASPREDIHDHDLKVISRFKDYLKKKVDSIKSLYHFTLDPETNKVKLDILSSLQAYVYGTTLTDDKEDHKEDLAEVLKRLERLSIPRTYRKDLQKIRRLWIRGEKYRENPGGLLTDLETLAADLERTSTEAVKASEVEGATTAFIVYDKN